MGQGVGTVPLKQRADVRARTGSEELGNLIIADMRDLLALTQVSSCGFPVSGINCKFPTGVVNAMKESNQEYLITHQAGGYFHTDHWLRAPLTCLLEDTRRIVQVNIL